MPQNKRAICQARQHIYCKVIYLTSIKPIPQEGLSCCPPSGVRGATCRPGAEGLPAPHLGKKHCIPTHRLPGRVWRLVDPKGQKWKQIATNKNSKPWPVPQPPLPAYTAMQRLISFLQLNYNKRTFVCQYPKWKKFPLFGKWRWKKWRYMVQFFVKTDTNVLQ